MTAHVAFFDASPDAGISERDVRLHDEVTPQRDESRRSTDASRLTFPIQIVIAILGVFLSAFGGVWVATLGMNSKIDIIQTQIKDNAALEEMKAKLDEANRKVLQQSIDNLKDSVNAVRGQEQLNSIEMTNIRREMSERQVGAKK